MIKTYNIYNEKTNRKVECEVEVLLNNVIKEFPGGFKHGHTYKGFINGIEKISIDDFDTNPPTIIACANKLENVLTSLAKGIIDNADKTNQLLRDQGYIDFKQLV